MYFLHIFLIVLIKKYMFITCLKNTCSFYMWFVKNIFMHRVFSWIITIKQLFFVVVKWMGLKLKVIFKGNILKTTLSRTAFPLSHSLSLSLSPSQWSTRAAAPAECWPFLHRRRPALGVSAVVLYILLFIQYRLSLYWLNFTEILVAKC